MFQLFIRLMPREKVSVNINLTKQGEDISLLNVYTMLQKKAKLEFVYILFFTFNDYHILVFKKKFTDPGLFFSLPLGPSIYGLNFPQQARWIIVEIFVKKDQTWLENYNRSSIYDLGEQVNVRPTNYGPTFWKLTPTHKHNHDSGYSICTQI